jgi:hypothetical protein
MPKTNFTLRDVQAALYPADRNAVLVEISQLIADMPDNIEQPRIENVSEASRSDEPAIRQLQSSPDYEQTDSPICLSSSNSEFISPFISNPTEYSFLMDARSDIVSEDEESFQLFDRLIE